MNDYDQEWMFPVFAVIGASILVGLLVLLGCKNEKWIHENCTPTEQVRIVEDHPTYVDVSGEGSMMVPIGGGNHQERAWSCPAIEGRAARTVWMVD